MNCAIADELNYHAMRNMAAGLEMAVAATKASSAVDVAKKSEVVKIPPRPPPAPATTPSEALVLPPAPPKQ